METAKHDSQNGEEAIGASASSPIDKSTLVEDGTQRRSSKRQKVTRSNGVECTYNASYTRGRVVEPLPSSSVAGIINTSRNGEAREVPLANPHRLKRGLAAADGANSDVRTSRGASPEGEATTLAGQYSGPTSAYSFMRRAWRRFGLSATQQEEKEPNQAVPIFSYGDKQLPRSSDGVSGFKLPDRYSTAELLACYFDFAMPTYRFLHQPTVSQWLHSYHDQLDTEPGQMLLLPARQAVVLMCLATAALFQVDSSYDDHTYKKEARQDSERFFQAAQTKLAGETGKVRLESVQARLAICLYLLHTSRPNQAWYTFGITVQILMALGMHRARAAPSPQHDAVTTECRKRSFWAASTLDTYLSVILGRPSLIHGDDVDQCYPEPVDDEELVPSGIASNRVQKDRIIQASISHAKITRIVKKALREQYSVQKKQDYDKLSLATKLNVETAEWQASLPVVLSGKIHPSSLIQIFQRQITVLELAHAHATMVINRPLLLIESSSDSVSNAHACLSAAKSTLDIVLGFVSDKRMFPSFWYTQYVTFNALSIVYVWLIQRKRGRLSGYTPPNTDEELFQIAETIQRHLAEATQTNAPSLRYSIILEELQQETHRLMAQQNHKRPPNLSALLEPAPEGHPYATPVNPSESSPSSHRAASISWESISGEFPLDSDLWLQLDSFPFSDITFDQLGDSF